MSQGSNLLLLASLCLAGCAPLIPPDVVSDLDSVREAKATVQAKARAPRAFANAEKQRREAQAAMVDGDVGGAQILGERAMVAYQQLVVTARVVQADARREALEADERRLESELATHETELQRVRADVRALEAQVALKARAGEKNEVIDRALGANLRQQARLLCTAARLLGDSAAATRPALEQAVAELRALPKPVGRKRAAEARQRCLDVLVTTRRARVDVSRAPMATDRMLAALSGAGWRPKREDAGIRVSLPSGPRGPSAATSKRTAALSEITSKHRGFSAILIIHPERTLEGDAAARRRDDHRVIAKMLSDRFKRFDVILGAPKGNSRPAPGSQQLSVLLVSPE